MPWEQILGGLTGGAATVAIVALLVGQKGFDALVGNALARSGWLRELRSDVDLELRRSRAEPYMELWRVTRCLPLWPRAADVTREDMTALSCNLREWYFNGGGMWLSAESRRAYEVLQTRLQDFAGKRGPLAEYDEIRVLCSQLRSDLTADLSSRRPPQPELAQR